MLAVNTKGCSAVACRSASETACRCRGSAEFLIWNQSQDSALTTRPPLHSRVSGGNPMLIGVLVTFLVVILVLYLINLLPLDGRAKQIVRVIVIILGVISLLKYIAVF